MMGSSAGAAAAAAATAPPSPPAGPPGAEDSDERRRGVALLLGLIALLLLAMGVGVLIGKAGKTPTLPTRVIRVGESGGNANAGAPSEGSFTSDWPSGKSGFTVELKTLPSSSSPAAVTAAKSAASAKGAKSVGALKAEEFSSLGGSGYVIYSGQYGSKSEAQKALGSLAKNFPGAKVVEVSDHGSGGGGGNGNKETDKKEASQPPGAVPTKPAKLPPNSGHSNGEKYEQESANLPDVVETH